MKYRSVEYLNAQSPQRPLKVMDALTSASQFFAARGALNRRSFGLSLPSRMEI